MATLLLVQDAEGKVIGRCDERCYDAIGKNCHCVCGGKAHGIGLQAAARVILAQENVDPATFYVQPPPKVWTWKKHRNLSHLAHPTFFELT